VLVVISKSVLCSNKILQLTGSAGYHRLTCILNRLRCRLDCGLGWAQGSMHYMGCTLAPPDEYNWTVHVRRPCKNGWSDRDAIWGVDSGEPKEACIRWVQITSCQGTIFREKDVPGHAWRHSAMSCAKMAEPIEMPFGLWTLVGPNSIHYYYYYWHIFDLDHIIICTSQLIK